LNLVFDLGGVVVRWDPDAIIAGVFSDSSIHSTMKAGVFAHPDWLELDRGTLEREEAIARAALRTGVALEEIRRLLHAVPPSLTVFPDTVDLLYRLKRQGYPLYCLSNMHFASIEYIESEHMFWEVFDGCVISCRLKLCKTESAIYEHLSPKYGEDRSRRYAHMEAGHAAQNLLLQAAALGLAAVPAGAFTDDRVKKVLQLPAGQHPLYLIPVGHQK
jgi:putative hydrolase of the HAD superfamily